MKNLLNRLAAGLTILVLAGVVCSIYKTAAVYAADPAPLQQAENQVAANNTCNDTTTNGVVDQSKVQSCITQTPVWNDIQTIVNVLSAGVAVVVTGVIILGGVQYTIAGDNPQALTAARQRIINGLIALFAFLFIWAFLQWLIPGGIFK